ncbi:hypothetical protein [Acinetobacter johnsonii]|uniref:hypothetical protein n=1 Tax=Acinetobacter johnsonii TaxID=40214 RepID=UPI00103DCC71|nr:hypothetical protein [Acinetobacter johnsonii]QBK68901.1 hypothetical protein E0Z08_04710 [Acinetobacter johnsonii]
MAIVNSRAAIEPKTGKAAIFVNETIHSLIRKLFANNEQGFAYDPNDLTTMFQDAAGTIPVTGAGQAVGLMLDKSKGLRKGANLVPQKSFAEGTAGWTLQSVWTFTGDKVICNGSTSLLLLNTKFVLGKRYRITIAATRTSTSGTLSIRNGATVASEIATIQATGIEVIERNVHVSDNNSPHIYFLSQGWVGEIISISIEEIAGNHAYQTTASMRPILQDAPRRIDFDAIDDKLITNLPAQLTGCTVVRSVPNVGTQILTGQTIPATYEDNKDHCGLIVINRALTTTETSQITKLFNKAAGV